MSEFVQRIVSGSRNGRREFKVSFIGGMFLSVVGDWWIAFLSFRQLLAGVGNLRMLANRVENVNEERDPIEDYISDCEDEDFLDEPGAGL